MEFLSQILVKAGLLVDGAVGFNNNSGSLSAAITWESSNMLQVNNGVANTYADLKARLFVSTNGFYAERSGNTVLGLNNTNGGKEWYIASLGNSNADPGSLMFNNETDGLSPMSLNNTSLKLKVDTGIRWTTVSSTDSVTYTAGISVDAANRLQINTGTDGVYGDLKLNELIATSLVGSGTRMVVADANGLLATQAIGDYITGLTGEATASGPGVANVTLSTSAVTGKLLTGVNVTGGSISATDSILTAFGKLQNQINGLVGGAIFQSVWNASTNTPTLASGVGTKGYYYIVDTAGSTNLDGINDWKVGDWAIFDGTAWRKVDNTDAVVSVNGYTGAVSLTTSDISEGTNLYYTNTRARAALSFAAGSGAYNQTTGVITIPTDNSQILNGAGYITTAALSGYVPYTGATTGVNLGSQTFTTLGAATTGTITLKNLASSASIVFSNSLSQDRFSIDDINNFNFRLNATPFALDNTYTRFSIIDALGTRFSINGDGALTSASGATFGSTVTGTRATFTSSGAFSTVTATNGNASGGAIQGVGGAGVGGFFSATGSNPALSANNNSTGNIANFANAGGNVVTISNAGNLTAASFIRTGGTSSQFLKADGSVDASTYLTQTTGDARYLRLTGGTLTGALSGTSGTFSGQFTMASTSGTNVGVGTTPSSWASAWKVVQVQNSALASLSSQYTFVGQNWYNDGASKYIGTGRATLYQQFDGEHSFFTSASGTAGGTISFTEALTIKNSGNVGIGTTSPSGVGLALNLYGGASTNSNLVLEGNNGNSFISMLSSATNGVGSSIFAKDGIRFAIATNKDATGFTEYGRLTSAGRWLFGTTTDDGSSRVQVNGTLKAIAGANNYTNGALILTASGGATSSYLTNVGGSFALSNNGTTDHLVITSTGAATFSSSVLANWTIRGAVGFNSYTTDGLFNANAAWSGFSTPNGGYRIRFGYLDQGGGQYWGRIGFIGNTNWSLGTSEGGNSFDIRINNDNGSTRQFIIDNSGAAAFSNSVTVSSGVITAPRLAVSNSGGGAIEMTGTSSDIWINNASGTFRVINQAYTFENFTVSQSGAGYFRSSVTATGFIVSSDARLKEILDQDGDVYKYVLKSDPSQVRYGYLSQDVEKWMPEAVIKNEEGFGSVNYIDVLVYKVRQLEKRIKELEG